MLVIWCRVSSAIRSNRRVVQYPKQGREQIREFGQRVRAARLQLRGPDGRSVSQERLAELTGLHRTYIGHVERGEVNVALWNIIRIAAALGVDPGELVAGIKP